MKSIAICAVAVVLTATLFGQVPHHKMPPTMAPAATAATLMKLERDANRAMQEKGVDGWMAFVAENAVEGGEKPATGASAVRASMMEFVKGGKLSWAPTHTEVFKGATQGYAVGRWTFVSDDAKTPTQHGTYITIWQKQVDRSWKIIYDGGAPDPAGKK